MKLTKAHRQELGNRTHLHQDTRKPINLLECVRCPRWRDAGAKVLGRFPTWYPSQPSQVFLQCPLCALIWDTRP